MDGELRDVLTLSIELERSVAKLYRLYSYLFGADQAFWWTLSMEEENHAALLQSCLDYFDPAGLVPDHISLGTVETLLKIVHEINEKIELFKSSRPSADEACRYAYQLEISAGEVHYQQMVSTESDQKFNELFQKLNGDDKDHYKRIEAFMIEKGIPL